MWHRGHVNRDALVAVEAAQQMSVHTSDAASLDLTAVSASPTHVNKDAFSAEASDNII